LAYNFFSGFLYKLHTKISSLFTKISTLGNSFTKYKIISIFFYIIDLLYTVNILRSRYIKNINGQKQNKYCFKFNVKKTINIIALQ